MDDIEKLEHLSLVQKVVSELYNHTGLHEQVLGKLHFKPNLFFQVINLLSI
jgi:hypothetical protein